MVDMIMYLWGVGEGERAAQLAQENYEAAWQEDFPHLHVVTARCLALFLPSAEQEALLQEALILARNYKRPMDEAGCLFSLAAITEDGAERNDLYRQAVALVKQMGCLAWLEGRSVNDPPLLPMTI
ncbi:MAG: hypothetical protein R3C44_17475 [Chloroflexota bacterium]